MAKSQTMGTTLTLIKAGAEPTNLVLEALKSIGEALIKDESQVIKLRALFDSGMVRDWEILTPAKLKIAYKAFVKSFTYGEKTTDGIDGYKLTLRLTGKPVFSKVA